MRDGRSPSAPDWLTLDTGESILLRATPSKNLLLVCLVSGMLVPVGVSILVSVFGDIVIGRIISFAGLLVFGGVLGGISLLVHPGNTWSRHNECVCVGRSIQNQTMAEVGLEDVRGVSMDQSWWQQVVDVGDRNVAADEETLTFESVENPQAIYEEVLALVE